jgi:hypothetical protein
VSSMVQFVGGVATFSLLVGLPNVSSIDIPKAFMGFA